MMSTRHKHQDLGSPFHYFIPGDRHRILPLFCEFIQAASNVDHLWHPVATAINWIEPLHAKYAWARNGLSGHLTDFRDSAKIRSNPVFCGATGFQSSSYFSNVVRDISQSSWRKPQD